MTCLVQLNMELFTPLSFLPLPCFCVSACGTDFGLCVCLCSKEQTEMDPADMEDVEEVEEEETAEDNSKGIVFESITRSSHLYFSFNQ